MLRIRAECRRHKSGLWSVHMWDAFRDFIVVGYVAEWRAREAARGFGRAVGRIVEFV